ncbi:hypothetical protein A8W25_27165 [Streptomyces sp. ERV7]|uniref:phosphatase PAP2 family protein n=1 Tax=Streptomyces sp. ERV7 TaxID=1322334 RepID=UPI0007F3BF31|nr:phosphatase PAP2 family protein [Streptomyces sp. ERV7]OAR23185.1 hypothetical protein A8W25_27165 [Streptomyces sp. ERV7]
MAAGIRPGTRRPTGPETTGTSRPPLVRELLLVTALFVVYKFGRQLANGHETRAFHNADRVWDWERALHLPGEGAVQSLLLHNDDLIRVANAFYATVHFPATVAFLVWLYVRRPAHYLWSRRVLALVTTAALALHILLPLAPPRMLASAGLVDTAQVYGPSVYAATPDTDTMANQFAAMPSLHFGWALMVAIGLIAATRGRLRRLWLLHPVLTLFVIVGTANHYWLDALVATALLGAALYLVPRPQPVRGGRTVAVHLRPNPTPRPAVAPEPVRAPESALTSGRTGAPTSADASRLAEALR